MQLCLVQGFIGVDIPKPRQKGLIEKQWLKLAMTLPGLYKAIGL